jgi:hypothetical protein
MISISVHSFRKYIAAHSVRDRDEQGAYMRSLMVALIALTTLAFASAPAAMANEAKPAAHAAAERHEAHKRAEHKEMRRHHVKKHRKHIENKRK